MSSMTARQLSGSIDPLLKQAKTAVQQGNHTQARQLLHQAVRQDPALAKGLNTYQGKCTYEAVAEAFDLEFTAADSLLSKGIQESIQNVKERTDDETYEHFRLAAGGGAS